MQTEEINQGRNYSTISPSAKALLFMKALTDIPYARAAADLMLYPEKYEPDFTGRDLSFWGRALHMESRYKSIDQLLWPLGIPNVLELSSGFSFRGLDAVHKTKVHYIDTDLPGIIDTKREFINTLEKGETHTKGLLEVLPLNALDKEQFAQTVSHFKSGPIAIINEGLLMYLDMEEKKRVCEIIRHTLQKFGGYWITADIYIRNTKLAAIVANDELQQFFEAHKIEEKKFASFDEAETFFRGEGFVIDKEAETDYTQLNLLKYFFESATPGQLTHSRLVGKIQATWRLKLA